MERFAVIVAGGIGTRMGSAQPKQFLYLKGKPIVAHTIERFYQAVPTIKIILVLPDSGLYYWQEFLEEGTFNIPHQIIIGGKSRTESVNNGLSAVPYSALVAIHDAVRPLVSNSIILKGFELAEIHGASVASVSLKDSIRYKKNEGNFISVNRDDFRLIQTPQTFQSTKIKEAYAALESNDLSDDATVLELSGYPITLFDGAYENIKITTPVDLIIAEAIMAAQQNKKD
jgi:2-C-methyl-D-erythritol 4-phosphate cytidylyltransferase